MNQQSAFDRKHIEEEAVAETEGLLDQFNLPPAVISFIRQNQRAIWVVVGCIAVIVIAASLYGTYRAYREDKAASALTLALKAEAGDKKQQLQQVVKEFGSTSSGFWGRIELAHLAAAEGNLTGAIEELTDIQSSVSDKDPLAPLLHYNLALLHEKNSELNSAIAALTALSGFKGFEKIAYEAMGRLYEKQGSREKALEMYRKYMSFGGPEAGGQPPADPDRSMIQARIHRLEK
jgi:predicted negative regulator of RcsB-dependent stress response